MKIKNIILNILASIFVITLFLFAFTWIIFDFQGSSNSLKDTWSIVSSLFGGIATLAAAYIASLLFNDWKDEARALLKNKQYNLFYDQICELQNNLNQELYIIKSLNLKEFKSYYIYLRNPENFVAFNTFYQRTKINKILDFLYKTTPANKKLYLLFKEYENQYLIIESIINNFYKLDYMEYCQNNKLDFKKNNTSTLIKNYITDFKTPLDITSINNFFKKIHMPKSMHSKIVGEVISEAGDFSFQAKELDKLHHQLETEIINLIMKLD